MPSNLFCDSMQSLSKKIHFPFLFVTLLWVMVYACKENKVEDRVYTVDDTRVERGEDVEILYSDSAVVRVRVKAPVMLNYTDRDQAEQEFPNGVLVDFLNEKLIVTSTLTAKHGLRQQGNGLVTMRDSVVLTTIDNEVLETEELIWDERSGRAYTDKFVKVTKPGEVMYGFGLEANQDFSYWKILVPKGRIKTDEIDQAID